MSEPTSTEAFSQLAAEMDLADYGRSDTGRATKKISRHEKLTRKKKRLALDRSDDHSAPTEEMEKSRKRLRGTRVAFEDTVLTDMPMMEVEEDDADPDSDEDDEAYVLSSEDDADDVIDGNDDEADKFPAGEPSTSTAIQLKPGRQNNKRFREKKPKISGTGLRKIDTSKANNQRAILRMRDFTSKKLAKQHSEAVGAHISGMSETAVLKLRDVAESAPGAHQVYSSLGMVFDGMISSESEGLAHMSPKQIRRRLVLAKKAFSSYNVAAALGKRDCVLWEKAGDAAVRVANLYSEILDVSEKSPAPFSEDDDKSSSSKREFDPASGPERWRKDRDDWFDKALSAYRSADSLKPPGIDIPCKLAKAHIRNGDYIDALSIFTDLRLKANGDERSRSSMEGSFPCWLLYAELMLKIGFQCEQWNAQESKIDNSTFKRWLRKHSKTFDWKGRRIQALCLALEAAAGTVSCAKLVKWMRNHANQTSKGNDLAVDEGESKDDDDDESPETVLDKSCHAAPSGSQKKLNDTVARNNLELEQFDVTSKRMKLVQGSIAYKNRQAARSAIIEKHRNAMRELVRQIAADESSRSQVEHCNGLCPLPLYGTYETVFDISLMLMRECIQLQLFDCGLLVVESFVNYSSERLQRHDRKMQRKQECEAAAANGGDTFSYDKVCFASI